MRRGAGNKALDAVRRWLFSYQLAFLEAPKQWRIVRKPRAAGFTEVAALGMLLHCLEIDDHDFFAVSTTTTNARRQILRRVKKRWLPLLRYVPAFANAIQNAEVKADSIELGNGSSIIAMANVPEHLRGNESTSYLFDEFAFWQRSKTDEIEDAVWPQIESEMNPNAVLWILSTPWSRTNNLYHDIEQNERGYYSQFWRQKLDIYDAVDAGLPLDIEAVKGRTPSQKWAREYLAQYTDIGGGYFDRDALTQLKMSARFVPWSDTLPIDQYRSAA